MAYRTPDSKCSKCGELLDSVTGATTNTEPSAGDATICIYCGHIMVFADDLTLRNPTKRETAMIALDKDIQLARAQILMRRQ